MKNSINDKTTMVKEVSNIPDSILKELSKITDFNSENGVHVLSVDADTFEQSDMSEGLKQLIRSAAPEGFLKSVKSSKNTVDPTITPTTTQPFASAERYTGLELLQYGEYGVEYTCKTDGDLYNVVVIRQQGGGYINKRTGEPIIADNTFLKSKFIFESAKEPENEFGAPVKKVTLDEAIAAYTDGANAWVKVANHCICGKCDTTPQVLSFENDLSAVREIRKMVEEKTSEVMENIPPFLVSDEVFVDEIIEDLTNNIIEEAGGLSNLRLTVSIPMKAIADGEFFIEDKTQSK